MSKSRLLIGGKGIMTNIQIGSLVLNTELIVYLAAGIASVLAIRFGIKDVTDRERDVSIVWSAVLLWILIWKGSLLLIDPMGVMHQPLSILFFSGGVLGFWLAVAVAGGYAGYRYGRAYGYRGAARRIGLIASSWSAVYLLAVIVISNNVSLLHCLGLFIAIALWLLLHRAETVQRMLQAWRDGGSMRVRMAAQGAGLLLILGMLGFTLYNQTVDGFLSDANAGETGTGAHVGQTAPAIELVNLQGESVSLESYRGSEVIINFWTTWCRVCKTEMPHVQKLYEHYRDSGEDVVMLSVNVTSQEAGVDGVKRYMEKYGYSFPLLLDEQGDAADDYRVSAYPTTYIVDHEGIIRERFVGAISYTDMKKRVERAQE